MVTFKGNPNCQFNPGRYAYSIPHKKGNYLGTGLPHKIENSPDGVRE